MAKQTEQAPRQRANAEEDGQTESPLSKDQSKEEKKRLKMEAKEKKRQKKLQQKEKKSREKEKNKQKKLIAKQKKAEEKAKQKALKADPAYRQKQKEKKMLAKETAKQKKAAQKVKAAQKKAVQKEKNAAKKAAQAKAKQEMKALRKDPKWQQEQREKKAQAKQQAAEKKMRQKEKALQKKALEKQKKEELKLLKRDPEWRAVQKSKKLQQKEADKEKKQLKKEKAKADKLRKKEEKAQKKAERPSFLERIRPQGKKQVFILLLGLFIVSIAGGAVGYLWQNPEPDTLVERHFKTLIREKGDDISNFFPEPKSFLSGKIMSDERYQEVKKIICSKIVDMDSNVTETIIEGDHAVVTVEILNYDLGGTIDNTLREYRINTMLEYVSGKYDENELENELIAMLVESLTAVEKDKSATVEVHLSKVAGKWKLDPLQQENLPLAQSQTGYIYKGDGGNGENESS